MKKSICLIAYTAALSMLASPATADFYDFDGVSVDVEYWAGLGYGSGDSSAMLVLDFGTASYAFGYTWNSAPAANDAPPGGPTGLDMLNAVSTYGAATPPIITYDGTNHRIGTAAYDGNFHIGDNLLTGFWLYYDSSDGLSWNPSGPGVYPDTTALHDLDWEGYALGPNYLLSQTEPDYPTTPLAPVPEPATGILLALGGVVIAARRRFKKG